VNIEEADLNPKLSAILTDMCSALTITNTAQVELIGLAKTRSFRQSRPAQRISSNSVPRKEVRNPPAGLASAREILHNRAPLRQEPLSDNTPWTTVGKGGKHTTPPEIVVTKETSSRPAMTTEEKLEGKFKEAIKESERSLLLHNLNMGNAPILNQETMLTKVTADLIARATAAEDAKLHTEGSNLPSASVIESIDDVLSVVNQMEFFGKVTKPCKIPGKNATFYTIPVKMRFKDRDTRNRAEVIIRDICQVSSSTPYPPILRECIRRTTAHYKAQFPGDYIRVNLDVHDKTLKVSRRPGSREAKGNWEQIVRGIKLPVAVLDVNNRKVPDDLDLTFPEPMRMECDEKSDSANAAESPTHGEV
jgi:hypothetical protein